jgi:hypothetical protein
MNETYIGFGAPIRRFRSSEAPALVLVLVLQMEGNSSVGGHLCYEATPPNSEAWEIAGGFGQRQTMGYAKGAAVLGF